MRAPKSQTQPGSEFGRRVAALLEMPEQKFALRASGGGNQLAKTGTTEETH
jgi:hypothetical protein